MHGLSGLKDKGVALALRTALAHLFAPYGQVLDVRMDSGERTLTVLVHPEGEAEPIEVEVLRYEVISGGGRTLLRLGELRCSREWMTRLANDLADRLLEDRCLPIHSPALGKLARKLL